MTENQEAYVKDIPTSADQLIACLEELGIKSETIDHAPVYTVAEAQQLRGSLPGSHIKNLFLRNKKEEMWLVVVDENKRVDLKKLGEKLHAGKLSFGSPDRLMKYLGVLPGAVTPFAIINDKDGGVRIAVDEDLKSHERINAHPLVNDKTTNLAFGDLVSFLEKHGHKPLFLTIE